MRCNTAFLDAELLTGALPPVASDSIPCSVASVGSCVISRTDGTVDASAFVDVDVGATFVFMRRDDSGKRSTTDAGVAPCWKVKPPDGFDTGR